MALFDWPEEQLRQYQGVQREPEDFDEFWGETLADAARHDLAVERVQVESPLAQVDVYDVTFAGFGGEPIKAWLRLPAGATGPLPTVVQYVGYGGGRGHHAENLLLASSGFAHLQMDTRGQGSGWSRGATGDSASPGPQHQGIMTRGILDPRGYYYRRFFTDAIRAVDAAKTFAEVDPARLVAWGGSQGGGTALAVAGLRDDLAALVTFVPFLCDFPRAIRMTDRDPYHEIVRYLAAHRDAVDSVESTLQYFDGTNFARRGSAPALFSAALMDSTCPPSTVFAAYNRYAGDKRIKVWPFNGHEGGSIEDELAGVHFLRELFGS